MTEGVEVLSNRRGGEQARGEPCVVSIIGKSDARRSGNFTLKIEGIPKGRPLVGDGYEWTDHSDLVCCLEGRPG